MKRRVSYEADLRTKAKETGNSLVTVEVPGMTFQGQVSARKAKLLLEFCMEILVKK